MTDGMRVQQHLASWAEREGIPSDLATILLAIADAGTGLAKAIARRGISGRVPGEGYFDTDDWDALGNQSEQMFAAALRNLPITFLAFEKSDEPLVIDPGARFGIVIDPLDGVSNIQTNTSFGVLFSVLSADAGSLFDSRLEDMQEAAGFLYYGPQTWLVVTCGAGTYRFLLDPDDEKYYQQGEALKIPTGRRELAINTSNYRFWDDSLRYFIDDCIAGESGPMGQDFELHWKASLVAPAFRILLRGGVFLYPGDSRPNYNSGYLRLLYDASPLAFIIEQAGGMASDGINPVRRMRLASLHERVPLIFGCVDRVQEVIEYISGKATENTRFPLFENRSLFRN